MSRVRVAGLVAIALLIVSPMAWATGFDCTHTKQRIELRICSDEKLMQLDEQLNQSFARARARAGKGLDALLRDQRSWLIKRNAALSESIDAGASAYQDRILYLDHLFNGQEEASSLLQAISEHMSADPSVARGTGQQIVWWPYLGGDGKVFSTGREAKKDDAKSFPFDPEDVVKEVKDLDYQDVFDLTFVLFDTEHFGGFDAGVGGMHIQRTEWQLFRWHGHAVENVDLPDIFKPDTAPGHSALSLYRGTVYALRAEDTGLATSDITAQAYLGDRWGDPVRLQLHYSTYLADPESYCAEKDCAKLTALAAQIIGRYDKAHDEVLTESTSNLSADQQATYAAMKLQAEKETTASALGVGNLATLPDFNGKPKYISDGSFLFFGGDGLLPVQWEGEVLLANISNACWGFPSDACKEDLLLGIWRWDGRDFTPVLGMVRHKLRGDFVSAKWLPADLQFAN
jgi:uncharacterized protein